MTDVLPKVSAFSPTQIIQKYISPVDVDAEINGWDSTRIHWPLNVSYSTVCSDLIGIWGYQTLEYIVSRVARGFWSADIIIHDKLRNWKHERGEPSIEFNFDWNGVLSAQATLAEDVVHEYIAWGFTKNDFTLLVNAIARVQFVSFAMRGTEARFVQR